jgi:transporter family-2 protein
MSPTWINYSFAMTIGVLISLMIQINGELSKWSHVLLASLIVHLVGSGLALLLSWKDRSVPIPKVEWYYWLAGIMGAGVIALNSFSFIYLGVALTVGMMFTTQTVLSLWLDAKGAFGRVKIPWNRDQVPGILLMILGLLLLLY